ncbi:hypothetical protein ABT354_13305 [Streptomyces sp. NPDC000594]|uniref:hypothetical protein n=1 Tax=Streptomyces sp. NPDC000594 TaxID=3154261 RepID=UPI003327AF16
MEEAKNQAMAEWGTATPADMSILTCVISRYACALIAHRVREAHPPARSVALYVPADGDSVRLHPAGTWTDPAGQTHQLSPRCEDEVDDLGEYLQIDNAEAWRALCTHAGGTHHLMLDPALTV